ncbi:MAG TPA: hypothetical protein VF116_08385 [Ktedonobacterales bacterium]
MATQIQTDAEREVAEFLAGQPSPQEILRFHPSPEVVERAHQLLLAERQNDITDAERRELDSYEYLEHLLRMIKAEAHRRLAA